MISTGVTLDAKDCRKAFRAEMAKLDPSCHSLLVYGNGSVASPKTLKIGRLDHALIDGRQYYICLTPKFFSWLQSARWMGGSAGPYQESLVMFTIAFGRAAPGATAPIRSRMCEGRMSS
jgi:hypothetical protein